MHRMLIVSLVLISITPAAFAQQELIRTVYRADPRPPNDVFQHGFTARGTRVDLLGHALAASCDASNAADRSAWVSTTADHTDATHFASSRLLAGGASGIGTMWIYEIRPDETFLSVRGVMRQAIANAEEGIGYTPPQAVRLRQLMNTTVLGTQNEVVAPIVHPTQVSRATPMRFVDGDVEMGPTVDNTLYVAADTHATHTVPNLPAYLPPASLWVIYSGDARSCVMSCDSSASASSRIALASDTTLPGFCVAHRQGSLTLEKLLPLLN